MSNESWSDDLLRASRDEIIGRVATINWSDLPHFWKPAEVFRGGHFYLLEQVHEAPVFWIPMLEVTGGQWQDIGLSRHPQESFILYILTTLDILNHIGYILIYILYWYFTTLDILQYIYTILYKFIQGTSVHLCTRTTHMCSHMYKLIIMKEMSLIWGVLKTCAGDSRNPLQMMQ